MTAAQQKNHLLIGTPAKVITDGPILMRHCRNIFEAITIAQQQSLDRIFVVYSEIPEPKPQALEALHQICPEAAICLLIRMVEEPGVHQWLRACSWANGCLDYLICPLSVKALISENAADLHALSDMTADMREKDLRIRELGALVMQDDLTSLKNRRYLRQFLPEILKKADTAGCQVTLLLFDIDDFKHYNDAYGHSVGDDVLRQTAKLMRQCCRDQDVVARLGGDEFAVVFWDVPDDQPHQGTASDRRGSSQNHPRQSVFMAERFRSEMSDTPFDQLGPQGKGGKGSLTISGGLATFPTDAPDARLLFEKADQAMLEAKRSGKNRIYLVGQPQ
ncbi:MAG: GGDEF domain-containing protein [Planctomycetota bacterium]|jgi:PleD family two-component response regulator